MPFESKVHLMVDNVISISASRSTDASGGWQPGIVIPFLEVWSGSWNAIKLGFLIIEYDAFKVRRECSTSI